MNLAVVNRENFENHSKPSKSRENRWFLLGFEPARWLGSKPWQMGSWVILGDSCGKQIHPYFVSLHRECTLRSAPIELIITERTQLVGWKPLKITHLSILIISIIPGPNVEKVGFSFTFLTKTLHESHVTSCKVLVRIVKENPTFLTFGPRNDRNNQNKQMGDF